MIKIIDFDKSITYLLKDFVKGVIVEKHSFSLILEKGEALLFRVPSDLQNKTGDEAILDIIISELVSILDTKGLYTYELDLTSEFKKLKLNI